MKYDFTSILDRHGQDALAVDAIGKPGGFAPGAPAPGIDVIPMWVADMNFPTAPGIIKAIMERAAHPAFGYFEPRESYYDSIIRWQQVRHGVGAAGPVRLPLAKNCIGYENGVLGGVVSALNVFCSRGDGVLVHSPTYIGFTNTLKNNGYKIVHSPLIYEACSPRNNESEGGLTETGAEKAGGSQTESGGEKAGRNQTESGGEKAGGRFSEAQYTWRMDYEDMEQKIREHHIHAAVFCSPHNPCGRVWTREELQKAYEIFEKYDVKVISDEIWSDIILEGFRHIPSQSVSEYARDNTVALYAPSKTFNLAGLVGSYHIIYNRTLRERIFKESSLCHYNEMNVLSMHALLGAYTEEGMEWVDELCEVLTGNVRWAADYIRTHFEGVTLAVPEGTYMLFADCTQWCRSHNKTLQELEQMCWRAGVALQDGKMFHGPCHLRINLALPLSRVQEAMERLDRYVFNA